MLTSIKYDLTVPYPLFMMKIVKARFISQDRFESLIWAKYFLVSAVLSYLHTLWASLDIETEEALHYKS